MTKLIAAPEIADKTMMCFEKFNFRKLNFSVVIGNPIEKSYDRMVKRFGGAICGYQRENVRLFDGKFYDEKLYEVLSEDYWRAKT